MMTSFSLLAIRPLDGCALRFKKVLKDDRIYSFNQEYTFHQTATTVTKITYQPDHADELYTIKRTTADDLPVSVSAVVGKNGAGKSSLFELLFLSVYVVANKEAILKENWADDKKELAAEELAIEPDSKKIKTLKKQILEQETLFKEFAAEVYYRVGKEIICLQVKDAERTITKFITAHDDELTFYPSQYPFEFSIKNVDSCKFYYSIVINYSLYGLHAGKSGNWLKSLFHKNDGYQTPLVINPFRDKGNININSEQHLAQSRLLANLLDQDMTAKSILEDKPVSLVHFELNEKQLDDVEGADVWLSIENQCIKYGNTRNGIFQETYEALLGEDLDLEIVEKNVKHFDLIVTYTIKKLYKIAIKYFPKYKFHEFTEQGREVEIPQITAYLNFLKTQNSHITLKLKQVLNCVRFNLLHEEPVDNIVWTDGKLTIPIKVLEKRIKAAVDPKEITDPIEYMPVAFYRPTFMMADGSDFHALSSGEQQLVHTIQSVIYHLINLNTVFNTVNTLVKYDYVNIMLDEVELYFHPEFQKRIVSELLSGISRLNIPHIKGINILFATHSPFILSDISKNHILKMEKGLSSPSAMETFGANIHDLLADTFFLSDGFMGDYAYKKIKEAISFMEDFAANQIAVKTDKWNSVNLKQLINHIGEPVLKRAMEDLYYATFADQLEAEIARLINKRKQQ
ncbi:MAG TPA: hypothetical protein ENO28_16640 [Bacteroidetes bacterium]|nr:hypothetical protein [Bacteroidota bacterium]